MSTMDRFKLRNKYDTNDITVGDAADAGLYSGIVSELAKGVGGIAQQSIAAKEAKKKEAEQKVLTDQAEAKRREATIAMNEARIAQAQAGADPAKLVAAQRKLDAANLLDQDARKLELKAGMMPSSAMMPYGQQPGYSGPGKPWWFYVMIGLGAAGVGYVGYKAFTSARTAPSK
jgi:hypothetical protein